MDAPAHRFTVGRDTGCDVAIADDSVSRLHAELAVLPDGRILLTDNHSRNGTAVIRGGKREPVESTCVSPNDEVQFGDVVLRVHDLLESLGDKLPAGIKNGPPEKVGSSTGQAEVLYLNAETLGGMLKRRWREAVIGSMVIAALIMLSLDSQSQTFRFIVGIMGSVIASLVFSLLQQFWQRK